MIDRATIYCQSGSGGAGQVSFRREKCIPFGGPDGGNGGKGGSVIIESTRSLNNLLQFKYQCHFKAQKGQNGQGRNCYGSNGDDIIVKVPLGTDIFDRETGELVYSFTKEEKIILLEGGKGGIGNGKLATSVNRVPRYSIDPQEGIGRWYKLKLKLIGDVAIVGLPNAGKSSLINSLTNSNSQVGSYAFTTMKPVLGVMDNIVLVDLPGIISGAAQGKGLGNIFLSHAERSKLFLIMLDINSAIDSFKTLRAELKEYNIEKPMIIVCNKIETLPRQKVRNIINNIKQYKLQTIGISVKYNIGLNKLRTMINNHTLLTNA